MKKLKLADLLTVNNTKLYVADIRDDVYLHHLELATVTERQTGVSATEYDITITYSDKTKQYETNFLVSKRKITNIERVTDVKFKYENGVWYAC